MQRTLVAFLNHGILPFVGRAEELSRILQFWQETAEAPGLRAMLLVGEAGIGKSRLIEEVSKEIGAGGRAVVHAKLYPDSSTSLAPLLARALDRSNAAQQLLKSAPDETIASVSAALLRICGLRPTLLILEDLHLLSGDALGDLQRVLEHLADEPLSILCAARPVEIPARSVLERYLVDELELAGLPEKEIASLCQTVFGQEISPEIVGILREKTLGNALALRSALRAGVKSGAISVNTRSTDSGIRVDQQSFVDELERNVRLLSEGMAAHLTDRERIGAERLASLGEVFASEAAEAIVPDAEQLLQVLTFKGILHTSTSTPTPLHGQRSGSYPLAFTHTLLHRYFVDRGSVDVEALVRMLASSAPLYSLLPFQLVIENAEMIDMEPDMIEAAIDRAICVSSVLDNGPDWAQIMTAWRAAEAMLERGRERMEPEKYEQIRIQVLTKRLSLDRRTPTAEFPAIVEQLMELIGEPATATKAEQRLDALIFLRRHLKRQDPLASLRAWEEVPVLVDRFPELRFCRAYVINLVESIRAANLSNDMAVRRMIEDRLNALMADEEASKEFRRHTWVTVAPHLLTVFETREEMEKRLRQLDELEEMSREQNYPLLSWRIALLYSVGMLDECRAVIDQALPVLRERGFDYEIALDSVLAIEAGLLQGGDCERAIERIDAVCGRAATAYRATVCSVAAFHFVHAGILLNQIEWIERMLAIVQGHSGDALTQIAVSVALVRGREEEALELLKKMKQQAPAPLQTMLRAVVTGATELIEAARSEGAAFFAKPVLTFDEIVAKQLAIDLMLRRERAGTDHGLAGSLRPAMRRAIIDFLDWMGDHSLPALIAPALEKYGDFLDKGELKTWQTKTTALAKLREEKEPATTDDRRIRVSLFGSITVQRPGEEPARVRGAQLCAILGLMAADRILDKPLSASEFAAIVMGTERDPDSVRKSMNFAVFRLREMLGSSEAISTAGETPALSFDLVEVDLVKANGHLRAAVDAMHEGALMRACPEILAALDIAAGRVPFPTLYDEFFEALREDFEAELRATVVRVARALIREGDGNAAEAVLGRAFDVMPGDEELAELLQNVLIAQGKRTKAQRVGMRAAESAVEM